MSVGPLRFPLVREVGLQVYLPVTNASDSVTVTQAIPVDPIVRFQLSRLIYSHNEPAVSYLHTLCLCLYALALELVLS